MTVEVVPGDDEDAVQQQLVLGLVAGLDALLEHVARRRHREYQQQEQQQRRVPVSDKEAGQAEARQRGSNQEGQRGKGKDGGYFLTPTQVYE